MLENKVGFVQFIFYSNISIKLFSRGKSLSIALKKAIILKWDLNASCFVKYANARMTLLMKVA